MHLSATNPSVLRQKRPQRRDKSNLKRSYIFNLHVGNTWGQKKKTHQFFKISNKKAAENHVREKTTEKKPSRKAARDIKLLHSHHHHSLYILKRFVFRTENKSFPPLFVCVRKHCSLAVNLLGFFFLST